MRKTYEETEILMGDTYEERKIPHENPHEEFCISWVTHEETHEE